MTIINLGRPVASVRERGFQPPWHTIYIYECAKGHKVRVKAGSFRGKNPEPGIGAITCPSCEFYAKYPPTPASEPKGETDATT